MPTTLYYEAFESRDAGWKWKIYRYDETGNREIVVHRSPGGFDTKDEALDDCAEFQDQNDIDATLS